MKQAPAVWLTVIVGGYSLLVVGLAWLIHRRGGCEILRTTRMLPENHFMAEGDWRDDRQWALACPETNSRHIAGQYLTAEKMKGAVLKGKDTRATPMIPHNANQLVYWVTIPSSVPVAELEPGARFDLCSGATCSLPGLRSEAIRCFSVESKRVCEVAVVVGNELIDKLNAAEGAAYRFSFRQ